MKGRYAIRILIIGSLYAVLYFAYTIFSLQGTLKGISSHWSSFIFVLAVINLGGLGLVLMLVRIREPLREKEGGSHPFIVTGILSVLYILMFTVLGGFLYKLFFFRELSPGELYGMQPGFVLQAMILSLFTGIVFAVADHSLDSIRHLQEIRLSSRKLQTRQVNLRFESLRSQISPHFLFNSLNTISSLIYRDIQMAEKFIRNLASVYQTVLKNYESPLIPLEEELRLVEHYSYLMRVRFEDAFYIEIDLPVGTGSRFVPPLCVQMLIENAIKHNHMSQETPLRISITTAEDYLVVRNNFIGDPGHVKIGKDLYKKPGQKESPGIGLQNIKNRYRMLSDNPVIISKDEYFTVSIPLIHVYETEMVHT